MLVCVGKDIKDEGRAVFQVQLWTLAQLHHLGRRQGARAGGRRQEIGGRGQGASGKWQGAGDRGQGTGGRGQVVRGRRQGAGGRRYGAGDRGQEAGALAEQRSFDIETKPSVRDFQ